MKVPQPLRLVSVASVLVWLGLAGVARAGIPERLTWVRGVVTAVTPTTVTAQYRNTTLQVAIDQATTVVLITPTGVMRAAAAIPATAYLNPGDTVEVHYRDTGQRRTVRYLWAGKSLDVGSISTRPGTSAAGFITDIKPSHWLAPPRLTVTSGTDRRRFDVQPTASATATRLQTNDRVVILYRRHRGTLKAQVLRVLPPPSV
jgi:hypothetical protein